MAYTAIESGKLSIAGSTGALLKRSLVALSALVTRSLVEVRAAAGEPHKHELFAVSSFIAEARDAASLDASSRGCDFAVMPIDTAIAIRGDRDKLLSALTNLLQNAFKFTRRHTEVVLNAYAAGDCVTNCCKWWWKASPIRQRRRTRHYFEGEGIDPAGGRETAAMA